METPSPVSQQRKEPLVTTVRPMREGDLARARRIVSLAFGTFIGVPEPEKFCVDQDYISTRWRANPDAALVAEANGELAGSCIATHWGSFGFFGPLTVRPDLWGQKVAQKLLEPTMDLFAKWRVREAGLYTFANSPKHIALYQKFGFWPRFLTALMSKDITARTDDTILCLTLGQLTRRSGLVLSIWELVIKPVRTSWGIRQPAAAEGFAWKLMAYSIAVPWDSVSKKSMPPNRSWPGSLKNASIRCSGSSASAGETKRLAAITTRLGCSGSSFGSAFFSMTFIGCRSGSTLRASRSTYFPCPFARLSTPCR